MQLNSEQINEIAAALAKAQSSMKIPEKDKVNPHFKQKYASLGSILSASKSSLNSNGLSVSQQISESGGKYYLVTTLMHVSGQWIRSYFPIRLDERATAQQIGSYLTYSKRYSLSSILGVDADQDDDGELASTPSPQKKESPKKELLSQEMINDLMSKLMEDDQIAAVNFCKKNFGTEDLRHLSKASYDSMMKRALEKMNAETEDEG